MGNNEIMLGVDGALDIVPDHPATSTACGHRARIWIRQRYLLVHTLPTLIKVAVSRFHRRRDCAVALLRCSN